MTQNDAVDSMIHVAKQFTAEEWEAAIAACVSGSVFEDAARAMRWVRIEIGET